MAAHLAARRPSPSRRVALVLAAAVGGVLAVYGLAFVAAGPGIARGTTVLGVPIGGQSPAQAGRTLERELRDEARGALRVRAGTETARIAPGESGLSLDVAATVDAAPARSWNPVALAGAALGGVLGGVLGGDEVEPVAAVDRPALRAAVDRLAGDVDRETVEGGVAFTGVRVAVTDPRDGRILARGKAVDALEEAYLVRPRGAVELPTAVGRPVVDRVEVDRVVRELAGPAVAGPVALTVEGTTVDITPVAVARSLTFVPDDAGRLTPVLDAERLHASVAEELAPLERPARDATFRIVGGTPQVVPSRPGREVLPASLAGALLPVLATAGADRAVTVPLEASEPDVGTDLARSLGVSERIASYTTYYPTDFAPRLTNIHRAADLMDRTLVLPGRVFSFNDTVGERTLERGFAAGFIINNGQLEVDLGGGVSQLVTTAFNAFFFAGLEIVEHNPHSFYISRYPEGRESTIAWGYKDLRVRNDSDQGAFVTTAYTSGSVTVTVWGTKRFRVEATTSARSHVKPFRVVQDPRSPGTDTGDCVATDGVPGFRVTVGRLFYQGGEQVRSEEFRTRYDPEPEVICKAP